MDNYTLKCKSTIGGLKRFYLAKFVDYDETEIITVENEVTVFPATIIYQFDCIGNYNQNTNDVGGDTSWTQEINANLNTVYNVLNPKIFLTTKFRLIAETNNGDILIFGLFNGLNCSLTNSSGAEKKDFNGFNLKLTGLEAEAAMLTDLDLFYIFDDTDSYLNYLLNIDL
jgi:hypothetical protein